MEAHRSRYSLALAGHEEAGSSSGSSFGLSCGISLSDFPNDRARPYRVERFRNWLLTPNFCWLAGLVVTALYLISGRRCLCDIFLVLLCSL